MGKEALPLSGCSSPLLLFFLTLVRPPSARASGSTCTRAFCYQYKPEIHFPFWIPTQQPAPCGNKGFEVSCSTTNQTLLTLPHSGQFSIQEIDYGEKEVWINDPDDCLPRRILSLNLSGSPFAAVYHQEFSFFNCSSLNYTQYRLKLNPIACLSSPSYTVLATSSYEIVADLTLSCKLVATVSVPVQWPFFEQVVSSDLSVDLWLTWARPLCGRCKFHRGRCGPKANSSAEVECGDVPKHGIPPAALYAVTVGFGIPGLLFLTGLLCCVCGLVKYSLATGRRHHGPAIEQASAVITTRGSSAAITGLDRATIESYPKLVLGESGRLPRPGGDTVCTICLSEYWPEETVRAIPDCNHFFHEECIDEWLKLNGTCPVCRNNPKRPMGTLDAV